MNVFSKLSKHEKTVLACAKNAIVDGTKGTFIGLKAEKAAARKLQLRGLVDIEVRPKTHKDCTVWWVVTLRDIASVQVETRLEGAA